MTEADWPAVSEIYAAGIATGDATFETEPPPSWEAFAAKRVPELSLVAVEDGRIVGWVAASMTGDRCVYSGVAEHGVYVAPEASGRGVGRRLLESLIEATEARGIWTIQSGVFPENVASLSLHERCGFRVVGIRERIGSDNGRWRDVVMIERRSPIVGV